jgi:hypothetical protein
VWAAWFVCLPAALQASSGVASQVYTIPLPASTAAARIEFQVAYGSLSGEWSHTATSLGGWEVTVAFDAAHCALHCTYRRTRDTLLLKPITSIRVYTGPGARPISVTVDPAGLGLPAAVRQVTIRPEAFGLPGKWAAVWPVPDRDGRAPVPLHADPAFSATPSPAAPTAPLPLRR